MAQTVILDSTHRFDGFDCGEAAQNEFLWKKARNAAQLGTSQTHVLVDSANRVVGYYAISNFQIRFAEAIQKVAIGIPEDESKRSIPAILLAQLAVTKDMQGKGIGKFLLKDAITKSCAIAESVGVRAMVVHADPPDRVKFYEMHGFESFSRRPTTMMALISTLRAGLGQ